MVSPLSAEKLNEAKFLQLDWGTEDLCSSSRGMAEPSPRSRSDTSSELPEIGMAAEEESLRLSRPRD